MSKTKSLLCFLMFLVVWGVFFTASSSYGFELGATQISFHGYLESNMILRDSDGFQYGFMDNAELIQQRNTLKFDVDAYPTWQWGPFSIPQIHFTYRGAVDSVFQLRESRYEDIPDERSGGPSDQFDYGRDEIEIENDLREAFMDIVYQGCLGSAFFRAGRQIVSWGETNGIVLLDVINPLDNSFQMFFLNPDDLMIPLWMGRLNYSPPDVFGVPLNFDILWVPDIRPTQFAPLDPSMEAPYAFLFEGLRGLNVFEDVPTDKREYGMRISGQLTDRLRVTLSYYRDVVNDPGLLLTDMVAIPFPPFMAPTTVYFTHGTQDVYGGTFSLDVPSLEIVMRGEFARMTDYPVVLPETAPDILLTPSGLALKTYRQKPITQWMLAIDKDIYVNFLTSRERTKFTVQWIHKKINSWDSIFDSSAKKNSDLLSIQIMWNWLNAKLQPLIFCFYDTEGTWMTQPSIKWVMTEHWYAHLAGQAFWGNTDCISQFAHLINTSELTFKLGYQW